MVHEHAIFFTKKYTRFAGSRSRRPCSAHCIRRGSSARLVVTICGSVVGLLRSGGGGEINELG